MYEQSLALLNASMFAIPEQEPACGYPAVINVIYIKILRYPKGGRLRQSHAAAQRFTGMSHPRSARQAN
jgi:hypothetical protein